MKSNKSKLEMQNINKKRSMNNKTETISLLRMIFKN